MEPSNFRDKLAVPAEDGVRLGGVRHVRKRLAAEPMTDFSERRSLGVREQEPSLELAFEDSVLSDKILIARQQLLIHRSYDLGKNASPVHLRLRPGSRYKISIAGVVRWGEQPGDRPTSPS